MAHLHTNSFLPSGAVDYHSPSLSTSGISPRTRPPPTSTFISPSSISNHPRPISPPQSRSPSAENASAAMLEDWRSYTSNLRSQFKGERAHMAADRARMEECMDEERGLWELERSYFVAQVAELETKLEKMRLRAEAAERRVQLPIAQPLSSSSSSSSGIRKPSSFLTRSISLCGQESLSSYNVPQESGRDANGAVFYAPAPRNPTRSFDRGASNLRLDSISTRENALSVSSKELKPSDFKVASPASGTLSPIAESSSTVSAGIDISLIQPGLEGVSIKASAVNPTFAAKILSPIQSPNQAPSRPEPIPLDDNSLPRLSPPRKPTSPEGREIKMLEAASAPENRRLTMHAGHTPNHSITKLPWLNDGDATPKQEVIYKGAIDRRASMALSLASAIDEDDEEEEDGDVELKGQLGLIGDAELDNPFLAALTEKLVEVQKSQPTSPGGSSTSTNTVVKEGSVASGDDEEEEDMPKLRLRSTNNFGRPMGSM